MNRSFCSIRSYVVFVYLAYMNYRYIYHFTDWRAKTLSPTAPCRGERLFSKGNINFWNLHVYVNRQVVRGLGYVARMEYGGYFGFDDFAFHTIFQL